MFRPLAQKFQTWRLRRQTIRMLRWMDDRQLADIGTERDAIDHFVDRQCD